MPRARTQTAVRIHRENVRDRRPPGGRQQRHHRTTPTRNSQRVPSRLLPRQRPHTTHRRLRLEVPLANLVNPIARPPRNRPDDPPTPRYRQPQPSRQSANQPHRGRLRRFDKSPKPSRTAVTAGSKSRADRRIGVRFSRRLRAFCTGNRGSSARLSDYSEERLRPFNFRGTL